MNLKQGLDERVHDLFIEGFYAGEYQAGQKVDPAVLAQQFSISRTPVIQASDDRGNSDCQQRRQVFYTDADKEAAV